MSDYPHLFARLAALLKTADASPGLCAFVAQLAAAPVFDDGLVFRVLEHWDDRIRAAEAELYPTSALAEMCGQFLAELRGEQVIADRIVLSADTAAPSRRSEIPPIVKVMQERSWQTALPMLEDLPLFQKRQ